MPLAQQETQSNTSRDKKEGSPDRTSVWFPALVTFAIIYELPSMLSGGFGAIVAGRGKSTGGDRNPYWQERRADIVIFVRILLFFTLQAVIGTTWMIGTRAL